MWSPRLYTLPMSVNLDMPCPVLEPAVLKDLPFFITPRQVEVPSSSLLCVRTVEVLPKWQSGMTASVHARSGHCKIPGELKEGARRHGINMSGLVHSEIKAEVHRLDEREPRNRLDSISTSLGKKVCAGEAVRAISEAGDEHSHRNMREPALNHIPHLLFLALLPLSTCLFPVEAKCRASQKKIQVIGTHLCACC